MGVLERRQWGGLDGAMLDGARFEARKLYRKYRFRVTTFGLLQVWQKSCDAKAWGAACM